MNAEMCDAEEEVLVSKAKDSSLKALLPDWAGREIRLSQRNSSKCM